MYIKVIWKYNVLNAPGEREHNINRTVSGPSSVSPVYINIIVVRGSAVIWHPTELGQPCDIDESGLRNFFVFRRLMTASTLHSSNNNRRPNAMNKFIIKQALTSADRVFSV